MAISKTACITTVIFLIYLQKCHIAAVYRYISKPLNFTECASIDPPYAKDRYSQVIATYEGYYKNGGLVIGGNLTIVRDGVYLMRFRSSVEKSKNVVKFNLDYKGVTCRNPMGKLVYNVLKVKYDPVACVLYKGNYTVPLLDVSRIDRAVGFIPAREPGVNEWTFTLYTARGTYFCLRTRILIEYATQELKRNTRPRS